MINAVGEFSLSLMIIIQGQDLMISWFDESELSEGTYVVLSESEFISDKIALKFLKHYCHGDAVDPGHRGFDLDPSALALLKHLPFR
jgi:hypothetical protein